MNETELSQKLKQEGFSHTYVWEDGAGTFYPNHTHDVETAHIILSGEMTLTTNGRAETYRVGSRCDVLPGAAHSAKMGPNGCRYLIGEKEA